MSLPQDNFERAVTSASETLKTLHGLHPSQIVLKELPQQQLDGMIWDLEAILAALRMEQNTHSNQPVDMASDETGVK